MTYEADCVDTERCVATYFRLTKKKQSSWCVWNRLKKGHMRRCKKTCGVCQAITLAPSGGRRLEDFAKAGWDLSSNLTIVV